MEEFRIVLADACKIVKESSRKRVISGADEDGRVMVEFSEPVGGRRVKMLTPDEINGILYKEETSESPANAEEAMAEETEPPTAGQEENGESALERIPKDAQTGEPQYTQTDAPTAWDAIVEQTEGDEDMARSVVDSTVRDKEAALKKLESSNPKPGATVAEKIAAAKEHKAAIEAARQELEQWKAIAEVENSRKAEEETKAEAERKAKANAEEERTALKGVNLSEEKDENGNSFVVSSDGTTTFGEVRDKSGLPAAPIKLSVGYQDKNGSGYGLTHIEANHGAQIKKEGFASVEDFVSYVAKNYDENNIKVGKRRTGGSITYLLQVTGKHDNTLFIELSRDGSYWNVNSAGVFRKGYSDKKETVAKTEPQQPSNAISERALQSADQSNGILPASPNGKPTVSASKVSESSETKQEKAEKSISAKVKEASADVNTEPTEAQKEAGNYKKGHVQVGTFDITIEQPEGSIRRGTDADGKQWESKMHNTYGYFRGTEGVDGDHIDVFLSNDMDGWNGAQVFVVDQYNPDGTFDEHKVMLGFNDASDAKNNYLANYKKGWENGRRIDVSAVSLADFEKWIASSHRKTKPFSEYKSVKPADDSETFKGHKVENSGKDIEVQIKHLEEIKDYPGADKKIVQSEIDRLKAEKEAKAKSKNVQGTNKTGAFGTIYTQFKGKAKEAIAFLLEKKEGEAVGALHHKDIGDIDLVWGNEKAGLQKIAKKHPEVLDNLQEIIGGMHVVSESPNRIKLESATHFAVVSKEFLGKERGKWLLTAYEKKKDVSGGSIDIAPEPKTGKQNGTAPLQDTVSASKVSESPETKQEKKEKSEEPKSNEKNGVDDAKIDAALEALDKGDEKAEQLVQGLTSRELSKLCSKVKASPVLENEWLHRVGTRGGVSLHDWLLENQYVEPVKRVSGTFRITDYTALKDSPYAERLGGVYHDNSGFAVATDARILVASKDDFDPKLKGKVIGKDGTVSESKFPDWQKAIPPAKETKSSNIDVEDLRKFVSGVLRANKRAYISLRFPDGTVEVFKANRLNLMLRAMKQLGTSELLYTKDGMKLVAKSEKGTAMLMGLVSVEDELVEANGYAYPGNTVLYHRGEVVSEMSPGERVLRDAVIDRLRESGMEVITDEEAGQRVLDEANGKAKLSAKKRRALETASLGETPRSLTVVSSAGGAKVLKSIDVLASEFEKSVVQPKTFIGDVAKALGAKRGGSASEYASFETKNGKIITIRLSNHNAKVSNFDANGEADGISIVVSPKKSEGMTNDGKAHVVEYYYDAIKLRRAEGKPLADIVRSIKQALYSGEFEDTTGLAERQEVNADDVVKFQRVYHGSGADFDRFDHSHMGEGEGAQAYGWGTYVTEVEGIGRTYAIQNTTKHNDALRALQHDVDAISDQLYRQRDDLNDDEEQLKRANEWRAEAELDYELFKDEAEKLKEKYGEASSKYQNHLFNDVYTDEMKRAQRSVESIEESIRYRKEKIAELEKALKDKQVEVDELPKKFPRHLYTVDIPDDTGENYLDWANALTDGQIERIRQYLVENYRRNKVEDFDASIAEVKDSPNAAEVNAWTRRGENVYKTLTSLLGTDKEVSKALSEMGFAGIKYPTDYQRGGREDGAKNYVIFNENDAKITDHVRFFKTKNGEAYGFTVGGKIYIDPKIANTETPIHEYAHLWAAALRGQNPKEWQNIVELMKGTSVWDEVKKRYPELNTDDDIADEVLATYSGRRGAERLHEEQRKIAGDKGGVFEKAEAISALERVKQALRKFWKSVADFLHIHYKTAEEVADRVMKDLLDGVDPGKHFNSRMDESKSERIEKLRESKPVEITGDEITPSDDLKQYKRNALEYGKKLRGVYTNEDTGEQIELTGGNRRGGLREILQHDYKDKEHLQSIAAIPQIIEKAIFIDELPNEDRKNYSGVRAFRYYVCGLKIADVDYTVKAVIAEQNNGERYYDHKLTKIEKGKLLSIIPTIQKAGMDSDLPRSVGKDSRLLSILQVKDEKKPNDELYRVGGSKELRDGRKIEFVRKPTATYNALARHLQAEGIKPDMHEARTGSRYMSFEKDGVQWEVRSSDHTKPEYFGEAQKPVELTYYKDKQGEENLSVSVDLGTSGYNIEDMKALMAEIDRLKNDAGEVKESFDKGVVSDEAAKRYPLLSQALGVKSENEVRAEEEAREHAEEARKQEMRSAVEDMAGKLHLNNVDIVDKPAERGAGRRERAKGMFERSTGRITINTGNCADKRDAVVTLLHEAVAHHGLRKLFGENFETFLDNVYNSANAEIRRIIDKHSRRYGGDKRTATEEYMASLAERTGFENAKKSGWWQRIKDFFLKMLEKIGLKGFKGEDLSDNELRYVLWRSYENLKSGGKDTVFSAADDLAKQSELNVGEFAPDAKKTAPEENAEEVNERFNNELTRYQNGEMDKNEMLHLGRPQGVMRTFLPNLPIVMRQRVIKKGSEKKHEVDVSAIMNMPQHLSSPIFVFQRSEDTIGVLTDMRDRNGKNVCVAIELKRQIQQGAEYLEVNDVRSFHGREFKNIVEPIANNKALKWVDKEKGLAYLSSASQPVQQEIDKQVLDTATKVVENFENPKSESENDALFRDGDAKDYEKAQARETYERRVSTGMFQSREAIQDSMLSLKVAMDAIEEATSGKAKRIEDYDGFENAYLGENRLSSVNQAESAAFAHLLIRPMMEEVNRLAPTAKDRAELIDYMFAKHGLERNAYMRQQAAEKKLAEYKKQNPGTAKTAADFIDAERDYAGLTTLTGKADVSAAEAEAQRMAADYENDYTFHGTWNEIYVCRKKIC